VLDLVPEPEPLGGAMLGSVHVVRQGTRTTLAMSRPPAGLRWAGPKLVWLEQGELRYVAQGASGERLVRPFVKGGDDVPAAAAPPGLPRTPSPGPAVLLDTRCDRDGCRTSLRLASASPKTQGVGGTSGSLQQRTPVE
jgi:hypothetical protein